MMNIHQAVGNKSPNVKSDVLVVQNLLNASIHQLVPNMKLVTDGLCGPITVGIIKEFQSRLMGYKRPDG